MDPLPRLSPGTLVLDCAEGLMLRRGETAVILSGLDAHAAAAFRPGNPLPRVVAPLARRLQDAGLADRPDPATALWKKATIRLLGSGALALAVAETLLDAGLGTLLVFDNEPPDAGVHPRSSATEGATALVRRLRTTRARVVRNWHQTPDCDLTVLAISRPEVDRTITDHLCRTDQPHVFARPFGTGAVVGPAVLPGRSPCTRCLDLTRCAREPAWPTLLAQLCRARYEPDVLWARWAAARVSETVWALLRGAPAELCGRTIELDPWVGHAVTRAWPLHPECGCGWGLEQWAHG